MDEIAPRLSAPEDSDDYLRGYTDGGNSALWFLHAAVIKAGGELHVTKDDLRLVMASEIRWRENDDGTHTFVVKA